MHICSHWLGFSEFNQGRIHQTNSNGNAEFMSPFEWFIKRTGSYESFVPERDPLKLILKGHLFMTAQVLIYVIAFSLQGQLKRVFLPLSCGTRPFILLNSVQTTNSSEWLTCFWGWAVGSAAPVSIQHFVLLWLTGSAVQSSWPVHKTLAECQGHSLPGLCCSLFGHWLSGLRYVSFQPLQTSLISNFSI